MMYIFFLFLTQIISHSLYGAFDDPIIKFNLKFPDGNIVSDDWKQTDFKKIRTLNNMLQDLGSLTEFTYSVSEDQTYLSHEYFHNLITGDFSNRMVDDLINYITNYNYFIGSEIYIQKSDDKKYLPFPSNLKWKCLKIMKIFFEEISNMVQNYYKIHLKHSFVMIII